MGVYNVTSGAETFTSNAYLVTGDRITLVDVGAMPGITDVIADHVASIDAVVITHQHGDHIAELDTILEAYAPDVIAYDDHPARTAPVTDGDTVVIGDEEFEVVHTPGHADDHISLVSSSTLFSGDVVVHDDQAFVGGSFGKTENPGQSRDILIDALYTLLERLPPTVEHMYSGHGDDYHGNVHEIVETAITRAERREPKYPD